MPFVSDGNRHLRHTFGHYPGTRISQKKTPALAEALKKTLLDHETEARKTAMGAGSWSGAWLINHWARLRNAGKAFEALSLLLKKTIAPNLFALNGNIFQMDGNSATCSGIVEMLLQSHEGMIRILPALPPEWPEGHVKGLCAHGGFEVAFDWSEGKVRSLSLRSRNGGTCRLLCNHRLITLDTERGKTIFLEDL